MSSPLELLDSPKRWLVTGAAGFIGSHLVEHLLLNGQQVVGLDNFETGHQHNLDKVASSVGSKASSFEFVEGDICEAELCRQTVAGVDHVLHQAALGSVPRSIANPIRSNEVNIGGFLNMLTAAKDEGVSSFTYAASSSTYGDHPGLPKEEDKIGKPLSPYALTKSVNEQYAEVFARTYGFLAIGLRYFNVYGPRQDPKGAYAAVIPKWIDALINQDEVFINGDGETSRDFCFVRNVVDANIRSALSRPEARNTVYNVACGEQTTLNQLFAVLRDRVAETLSPVADAQPTYRDFREGDVRHSLAAISKIHDQLGYEPLVFVRDGLNLTVDSFLKPAVQRVG